MSVATTRLVRGVKHNARFTIDGPALITYQRKGGNSKLIFEAAKTTRITHLEREPPPEDFLERFRQADGG